MNAEKTIPAKITRPSFPDVLHRTRLFSLLDAQAAKPVVWVSAPAGSGKTTLVSSWLDSRGIPAIWYQCDDGDADLASFFYYLGRAGRKATPRQRAQLPLLTPEYLAGASVFTRRFFEQLCSRLLPRGPSGNGQPAYALVFDNVHDIPADTSFHDMLAAGFESLSAGVQAVVISRTDPPPSFARLMTNNRIALLGYHDIRFTGEESRELVRGLMPELGLAAIRAMHRQAEGWAAGIVLLLERARLAGALPHDPGGMVNDRVFAYLNEEIFNKAAPRVQEFLLKTALMPAFSTALAEKLTGVGDAGRILSALTHHHFLTQKLSGGAYDYQYHPLYREFLLNRGESHFSPEELVSLQRTAALLLEETGHPEDAARLYCAAADRESLVRLVTRNAQGLLAQGRNRTVSEWISCIAADAAGDDPWLLYWTGMCSFPFDLSRARFFLKQAFDRFTAVTDTEGIYRSWAGIVDTYTFGLDEWHQLDEAIDMFEELINVYPLIPSNELNLLVSSRMLIALTLRKTDEPHRVHAWLERVNVLLEETPSVAIRLDTVFSMSVYYLWKGEYHKNIIMLEKAEAEIRRFRHAPFAGIRIQLMKGIHFWITAEYEKAARALSEGLDISRQSGVPVFNSLLWGFRAAAELASGNMKAADTMLQNQAASLLSMEQTLDLFFYHVNSAWRAMLSGNPSLAADHMETIAAAVEKMGTPYYRILWKIGMAHAGLLLNRTRDAKKHIREAHRISLQMKSHVMEWNSLLVRAYVLLREGRSKDGLSALRDAFSLGHRFGYVHLEFYRPEVMQYLCARALSAGIEPDYATGLIRKLRLAPPQDFGIGIPMAYVEGWPYPVRICTLGRFEIFRDDRPVAFAGKIQKKPLDLLKAIIALGGTNVSEDRLIDGVWSDTEGDRAHKSFEMALSRLRALLGSDDAVHYHARQISLNFRHCWIDSSALEQIFDAVSRDGTAALPAFAEKAVNLYKGPFLPSETGMRWAVSKGELLKNRLIRLIVKAGRHHEQAEQWDTAIDLYLKGIDMDYLAEEFYQRLMVCYQALGNRADAVKTYNRCRSLLKAELGIEPSSETEALYKAMIRER